MTLAFVAQLWQLALSVVVSVGAVGVGYFVARRFQKLGGGEAQNRLNKIRKELDDAMTEKVTFLEVSFTGCKTRLAEVEATLRRMRKERIEFKQEILDLHTEIREVRQGRVAPRRPKGPVNGDE